MLLNTHACFFKLRKPREIRWKHFYYNSKILLHFFFLILEYTPTLYRFDCNLNLSLTKCVIISASRIRQNPFVQRKLMLARYDHLKCREHFYAFTDLTNDYINRLYIASKSPFNESDLVAIGLRMNKQQCVSADYYSHAARMQ